MFASHGKACFFGAKSFYKISYKIVFVDELARGFQHFFGFGQTVCVPLFCAFNDESKETTQRVGFFEFSFESRVTILANERLFEVDIHQSARDTWVASVANFRSIISRKNWRKVRFDSNLFLVEFADGNEVRAREAFEFGNVQLTALRQFLDDCQSTVFKRIKFGGGCVGVFGSVGFEDCARSQCSCVVAEQSN